MTDIPTYGTSRPLIQAASQAQPLPTRLQWQDLGAVQTIAETSQPPLSRAIVQLQPFGNRIFLGYGEWDIGLDYCDLIAWNTDSSKFEQVAAKVATDAFWSLRIANNELWALVTDPSVGTDPDVVVFDGQNVRIVNDPNLTPWHLFDLKEWQGALYLAGANRVDDESYAAIWRSTDDGNSWVLIFQIKENLRMHGVFSLGELLYAVGLQGQTWSTADGESWRSDSVNLLPRGSTCVHPVVVAGQAAYLNGWSAYGPQDLCVFDGAHARLLEDIGAVICAFGDGSSITVLTEDQRILQSTNLKTWNAVTADVPANGRSLCTLEGTMYLGTADSHFWRLDL